MTEGDRPDFGGTTAVIVRKVRKYLTPKALWSFMVGVFSIVVVALGMLARTMATMEELKLTTADAQHKVADMQQELKRVHELDVKLEGMTHDIAATKEEVAHQRDQWDRVQKVAEEPLRTRRRK